MWISWIYLFAAGLLEIVWAIYLQRSSGFSRLIPSIVTGSAMLASFLLLGLALRTLPIGTAYAIWTGIGAAGTAIYGMVALGESRAPARIFCLCLILVGTFGLKLAGK